MLNLIWGITALANKDYFVEDGLVCSSLSFWGWIAIVVAAVQITAGGLLFARKIGGVIMAIVLAMCGILSISSRSAPTRCGRSSRSSATRSSCGPSPCTATIRLSRHAVEERWSTGRVEAFSDGVLAIAITLLVLEIKIDPSGFDHPWRALADEWPSYLAYVTSFLTIGGVWLAHHALFSACAPSTRC